MGTDHTSGAYDIADKEGPRGIAVIAMKVDSDVNVDNVTVFEPPATKCGQLFVM